MRHFLLPACATILLGCASVPPSTPRLDVTLADVTPTSVGLFEQQYRVDIRVQNPSEAAVVIDGFAYRIEINGKPFARGVSDQSATVPRFGQSVLSATAVSSLSGLVEQIRNLAGGFSGPLRYRLTGSFSVIGAAPIPFDQRGELGAH